MVIFSWFILQPSFSLIKDFGNFVVLTASRFLADRLKVFPESGNEIDWEGKIEKSKTVVYDDVAKQAKSKAKGVARKKNYMTNTFTLSKEIMSLAVRSLDFWRLDT